MCPYTVSLYRSRHRTQTSYTVQPSSPKFRSPLGVTFHRSPEQLLRAYLPDSHAPVRPCPHTAAHSFAQLLWPVSSAPPLFLLVQLPRMNPLLHLSSVSWRSQAVTPSKEETLQSLHIQPPSPSVLSSGVII